MNKENVLIYTIEFYPATKKKEMSFAGKCMELKNIMLCEISRTQKNNKHVFSHVEFRE